MSIYDTYQTGIGENMRNEIIKNADGERIATETIEEAQTRNMPKISIQDS